MPAISVVPESATAEAGGGPVLAGVQLRRPSSRSENQEPLRTMVELGDGSTRAYDQGVRPVFAFSWAKLREDEADELRRIVRAPFVTLRIVTGAPEVVVSTEDALSVEAIAGTHPVRYSASLTLKGRDPIR